MGRQKSARQQLSRSESIHPAPLPQRLEAGVRFWPSLRSKQKRQRTAALQDLSEFRALLVLAKRLGVRLSSAAFARYGNQSQPLLIEKRRCRWHAPRNESFG